MIAALEQLAREHEEAQRSYRLVCVAGALWLLNRLGEAHVLTYRTDMEGAVTFYLDGKTVSSELAALH